MELRVKKWGNSFGIRIPRSMADDLGLHEDSVVDLQTENGRLVIRPKAKAYTLTDLLALVTPENVYDETDWGRPVGEEIW